MAHMTSLEALSVSRQVACSDANAQVLKRGPHRRLQRGAFAPIVAIIAVPVLLGMFGLSYSVADLLIARTQLQAATDACALAAATQLAIEANSSKAADVGLAFAKLNHVGLAHKTLNELTSASCGALANSTSVPQLQVCFSTKRDSGFSNTPPTGEQKFARCQATQPGFLPTLIAATTPFSVNATSVAGIGKTENRCIMPFAVCPLTNVINVPTVMTGAWSNQKDKPNAPFNPNTNTFRWVTVDNDTQGGTQGVAKSYLQGNGKCPSVNQLSPTTVRDSSGNYGTKEIQQEWAARSASATRKMVGAAIVDCSKTVPGLTSNNPNGKVSSYACMELQPDDGSGQLKMIYRGDISDSRAGCIANYGVPIPNSAQGQPIAALAQ
jgi:Flp pilus assembly protein TadG